MEALRLDGLDGGTGPISESESSASSGSVEGGIGRSREVDGPASDCFSSTLTSSLGTAV